jgi:hypothetical protein
LEVEARVSTLWLWVSQCKTMEELRLKLDAPGSATVIKEMARRIVEERASTYAIYLQDACEANATKSTMKDPVLRQNIMLCRDILLYSELNEAISKGDVGHLDYLVPVLLTFFKGSGSGNYSKLMWNYLQWKKEAPVEAR